MRWWLLLHTLTFRLVQLILPRSGEVIWDTRETDEASSIPGTSHCTDNTEYEQGSWQLSPCPRVLASCNVGVRSSAVKRSIGFAIGFHNHGKGKRPLLGPSPGWKCLLALSHYANQSACPEESLWLLFRCPNFTSTYCWVNAHLA